MSADPARAHRVPPWRDPMPPGLAAAAWVTVALVAAADVAILAVGRPEASAIAWVVASTLAGIAVGVAIMVPVVREAQDDARTFMSFGPESLSPAARHREHAPTPAGPPTGQLEARTATIGIDRAALDARMGRAGARFALGVDEARATLDRQHDDRRNP